MSTSKLRPIMLAGTGSDVGKSLIAAGLCRIFKQDGYTPAPFKAQNMALNSYATPDGREIGRAQAVQAEAAGIPCCTDMNPVLLKPSSDMMSQVIVNGVPIGNRSAGAYFRRQNSEMLRKEAHAAFDRLSARYNPIVLEGAGSISEVNLRDTDIVNMSMARYAGAAVILVADIDRGGVFASAYGSVMLQTPEDRKLIKGIIINKFRGDIKLFDSGRTIMEEICGVPVIGVVPYTGDIHIEEEDSLSLEKKMQAAETDGRVNVAVVRLRHISNFTDFDALEHDSRVNLYYTDKRDELLKADIIIIPGSKATIDDIRFLRDSGLAEALLKAHRQRKTIIGICGGYQIMGREVADPDGVEGNPGVMNGLGLLPVRTVLSGKKVTQQVEFRFNNSPEKCQGYEIHMGVTQVDEGSASLNTLSGNVPDGCMADARTMGTYIHGILDNAPVIDTLLKPFIKSESEESFDYKKFREQQYDALSDLLRESLDMDLLYKILRND
ncbi:MAG: cobyric acid synthase [Muribaculaceae bacterium]|nr:cobyric acid synthase [Muribaculaceae bacterium]